MASRSVMAIHEEGVLSSDLGPSGPPDVVRPDVSEAMPWLESDCDSGCCSS
jgi:hypothetical protein